ncbi:hypothetical protein BABINDRAFT_10780 [Babjeviella inositovora NRRL Y-12698]|uniref:Factor arrest protein 11 n=1 Tax=Babjeviella inositovora NRRL Y-12698 TaxID=984486 RepID=A0A1E3QXA9_9ASCO|nr:uncharacterized protein BABINDRAFT_10780 [Babjeviella inositovora NRRL Y-12698]ODQ82319.1 hypothetical protein BABINDRAFT_10780 [Babjeviella inositovora NRRL Y-12698]
MDPEIELFEEENIIDIGLQSDLHKGKSPEEYEAADISQDFESLRVHSDISYLNSGSSESLSPKRNLEHLTAEPLDDEFQRNIDERAHQIGNDSFHGTVPKKANLQFQNADCEDLRTEINDWFSITEIRGLNLAGLAAGFKGSFTKSKRCEQEKVVKRLLGLLKETESQLYASQSLLYIAFGCYAELTSEKDQVAQIVVNGRVLLSCGVVNVLSSLLKLLLTDLLGNEQLYYNILTILYFVLVVYNDQRNASQISDDRIRSDLAQQDLFSSVIMLIERWRWNPQHSFRIRNLLLVAWKLALVELGGMEDMKRTKAFLRQNANIADCSSESKVTALDFHVFREDVTAKFPTYNAPVSTLPELFDNPGSLSQLIDKPRPLASNSINIHLPTPEIHISTPAPSPPSTPLALPASKIKRTYQTNQSFPFLYPSDSSDEEGDASEHTFENVPYSIKEAGEIIYKNIRRTVTQKQLWLERNALMRQERGWIDTLDEAEDGFIYSEETIKAFPVFEFQIRSLMRTEELYGRIFPNLSSLVYVIVQVIKSNNVHLNLSPNTLVDTEVKQQLELLRVKELSLKAATGLLLVLGKWFKLSHVLKWTYFSSIIFDNDFYTVVLDLFSEKHPKDEIPPNPIDATQGQHPIVEVLQDSALFDRLLNPAFEVPEYSFFAICIPRKVDQPVLFHITQPATIFSLPAITEFNWRYAYIMTNLFTVMAKVSLSKTQRVIVLCDKKPSDTFRYALRFYNAEIYAPVLKMVKTLVAYNGRKWKSNNMDLISLVYLHSKLGLRDNWLTGKDIEGEIRDAYAQEVALRGLAQYYHMKRYKGKMADLGYEISEFDFFGTDIDVMT